MGPAEFPTRDEFERLSEDEQFAHLEKLRKEIDDARTDTSRLLEVTKHWSDIAEWTLEPEEYERLVRMPAWNAVWENPERIASVVRDALTSGELTAEERQEAETRLQEFEGVVEHKRDLENL